VERIDNSTLNGKFILGFQGWFACPDDGNASGGWIHWFNGKQVTVDLLPDVSELAIEERCETGFTDSENRPVELFSDQRYATVLRQFAWMRDYGLDGVAVQRFAQTVADPKSLEWYDRVLDNVRRAAEATGRVFFVEYDTGDKDGTEWPQIIEDDWRRLLVEKKITQSSAYLRSKGKPILGLTGPGFTVRRTTTPDETLQFFARVRSISKVSGPGITLLGTVPRGWRTLDLDSSVNPGWARVYRFYDVISPWLVGTVTKKAEIDKQIEERIKLDLAETGRLGIDYMPVVFPGFSVGNLRHDGRFNQIPRQCGRFLWDQATGYIKIGVTTLFGAMFDEVDEGTAMFKLVDRTDRMPVGHRFLSLDEDGCDAPSDWYLRVAGAITKLVEGQRAAFPSLPPGR
jgi:hypothetical protein